MVKRQIFGGGGAAGVLPPGATLPHGVQGQGHAHPSAGAHGGAGVTAGGHPGVTANSSAVVPAGGEDSGGLSPKSSVL